MIKQWPNRVVASLALTAGLSTACLAAEIAETKFPWREAGLSERDAATHLLSRFTFGPRLTEIDGVIETGLEAWLETQLAASIEETVLQRKLEPLDILSMSGGEIADTFPFTGRVVIQLAARGLLESSGAPGRPPRRPGESDQAEGGGQGMGGTRAVLQEFYREHGYCW